MSTNTSIGGDPTRGSNDNPGNADGCGNKTLGSHATQAPPTGADPAERGAPDAPDAARGEPPKGR